MSIQFTKMHGLGNDFVVIDATQAAFTLDSSQIQQMADRHTGIGFDQLLLIQPSTSSSADFIYRIFNADGGEVAQCGNGARAVARYIFERGLSNKTQLSLQTEGGLIDTHLNGDGAVTVAMGVPDFSPQSLPFLQDEASTYQLQIESGMISFWVASIGNPHAVIPVEQYDELTMQQIGKQFNEHESFPEGVNVGFLCIENRNKVNLHVYERGVGMTLACGSGACAAVAAGIHADVLDHRVVVSQPGGDLIIDWPNMSSSLLMSGPAQFVYHGEWINNEQ